MNSVMYTEYSKLMWESNEIGMVQISSFCIEIFKFDALFHSKPHLGQIYHLLRVEIFPNHPLLRINYFG